MRARHMGRRAEGQGPINVARFHLLHLIMFCFPPQNKIGLLGQGLLKEKSNACDSVQTTARMLKNEAQRRHQTFPMPHSRMADSGNSECRPKGLGLELSCTLAHAQRKIPCPADHGALQWWKREEQPGDPS